MYQSATQRAVMHGLFYLDGVTSDGDPSPPDIIWGTPGKTTMISCGGQTGFYLSVDASDSGNPVPYEPSVLGQAMDSTYQ